MGYLHLTLAAALGIAVATFSDSAAPASRPGVCSIIPFPSLRDDAATLFIAVATGDTLAAGPGLVEPSAGPGHWGRPSAGHIAYGQVVVVEQVKGAHVDRLRAAWSEGRDPQVLLVPWDYDPTCRRTYWTRGARWVAPDSLGFYRGHLRPDSLWAGGMPTLDIFTADIQPYPHGSYFQRGYRDTDSVYTESALSPAELLELYTRLPTWCDLYGEPQTAARILDSLRAETSGLVARYPGTFIADMLQRSLDQSLRRPRDVSDRCPP